MPLGDRLERLEADRNATTVLEVVADLGLAAAVAATAARFGEAPADDLAAAVRRSAAPADDMRWPGPIGALQQAPDPARLMPARRVSRALEVARHGPAPETGGAGTSA